MLILIYALAVCIALILFLAAQLAKYVAAFKDTATKLWNVTQERDALITEFYIADSKPVSTLKPEHRE